MKRLFLILCCLIIPFLVQAQHAPGHSNAGGRHLGSSNVENFDVETLRNRIPQAALERAMGVQRNHEGTVLARPGVIGMGVGVSSLDNVTPVVQVFVDGSGGSQALPQALDGVDVEVIQVERYVPEVPVAPRDGYPVLMGQETSPLNRGYYGTLGFRAHRTGDPLTVGYVTNNHVASTDTSSCATTINPESVPPYQLAQCQPSSGAGCTYGIGNLIQTVPLFAGEQFSNTVDAAFVVSDHDRVSDDVVNLEPIRNENPMEPFLMLPVIKSGARTGVTEGYISTINATLTVGPYCGDRYVRFVNQAIVTPTPGYPSWSLGGDSGSSVWVNNTDPQLVGLHFAGNGYTGIINPISAVLGALGVVPDFSGSSEEPPPDEVIVPNVIGMMEAAATTAIQNADLNSVVQYASNAAPIGTVFDQTPSGGTHVVRNSTVTIWVSTGPGNVTVPDVVGTMEAAATTAIQNAGLVVSAISRVNNAAPAGTVIGQEPTGGTSVPPGSGVTLTVSLGPAQVSVPNVINMTETAATTAIQNAGLVANVIARLNDPAPAGTVIGQQPTGGTQVAPGYTVNLTVSLGSGGPVLQPVFREAENYSIQFGTQVECGTTGSGGCNVGYIANNDWTQYSIDFTPSDGGALNHTYIIRFRYAAWGSGRSLEIWDTYSGTRTTASLPVTGSGYYAWNTIDIPFNISSDSYHGGQTEIRFIYHGGSLNADSIEFIP